MDKCFKIVLIGAVGSIIFLFLYLKEITIEHSFHIFWRPEKNYHQFPECRGKEYSTVREPRKLLIESDLANKDTDSQSKLILFWTGYFRMFQTDDFYYLDRETYIRYKCPLYKCRVTNHRSLLSESDAVIFHGPDINFNDFPKNREANQLWIFYNLESPLTYNLHLDKLQNVFNWTMTYREDSDVVVKYGHICKLPKGKKNRKIRKDYWKYKTKDSVAFISNCHTSSKRESYIKELQKYVTVDIYGKCGTETCFPPKSTFCYSQVLIKYKFYLSFENSICKDYVTEKLFNILNYDIIPVVFGGVDYSNIMPPHSYIDATKFPEPKNLAKFLIKISSDFKLYNSYFWWKKSYRSYLHPWMCELCKQLHEKSIGRQIKKDLRQWFLEDSKCLRWTNESAFIPFY